MKTTLLIHNDYSQLITEDRNFFNLLWRKLRFRKKNYFHTRAYQNKKWDGFIDFLNKKNGKFLTGLLPEIQLALRKFKVKYEVKDFRQHIQFANNEINKDFLKPWVPKNRYPNGVTLEDYQVEFANHALNLKRGIIQSPTASGKTLMLISMMKSLPKGLPTLFLCNKKSVVQQNYEEIMDWGFENVGMFNSDKHEANLITCANVQSIHHLEKLLPKFKALFVDEVHLMMSNTCISTYKKMKDAYIRIGLSATPFKDGEMDKVQKFSAKGFFSGVYPTSLTDSGILTVEELQKRGRLAESICHFYYVKSPELPYEIYQDAVTRGVAQNYDFHKIVKKLVKTLKGRTLIIVERLTHGDILHKLIPNSLWVQGKDDDNTRKDVINQLKKAKGNVVAIATSGIFDAGINVFIHNLVNAAGGKAEHNVKQRMGRGLRTAEDKERLNYYDFIFTINPYLLKHSNQRIRILQKDKHELIIHPELDF